MYPFKSILLFSIALFLLFCKYTANSQVSKGLAINIVMENLVVQDSIDYNVYLFPTPNSEDNFNLSPYDSLINPYDTAWLFFIDLMPQYGWAHPCMYVFICKSTGEYTVMEGNMPPLIYWLNWEEVSVPFPHQNFIQSTDTTFQTSYDIIPDPHKYALLITWWAKEDQARWNNLSHVYSGLTQTYGFLDSNIFVLSGDGYFNPDSMNLDLNGDDFDNDFDGPCTKEKIDEIFYHLDTVMTDADIFLFYATTHGDTLVGDPLDTTSLRLWNYEKFYDYELEEMVDNLDCSQMVFCIDACNAGGFIEELEGEHRVIQVPVPRGKPTIRFWNDFDNFTYGWATAMRGWHVSSVLTPWEQSEYKAGYHPHLDSLNSAWINKVDFDPDSLNYGGNQDGFLQFGEVFNYTQNLDSHAQQYDLDYQNHGFIGDLLTLNGIEGRVDTSQSIEGNYLIGRKLTLAPGTILSDGSGPLYLYLNDSTEILVDDSAKLNINCYTGADIIGCSGESFINVYGDLRIANMDFIGRNGAKINLSFKNTEKQYSLNTFEFKNTSITADCQTLRFDQSSFINTDMDFSGSDSFILDLNTFENCTINFSGGELNFYNENEFSNSNFDLSNGNIIIEDSNRFINSSMKVSHPVDEAANIEITDNFFDNDTSVFAISVISIEDYANFLIDGNNFLYGKGRGIELFNAGWDGRGVQQILGNYFELTQPSTSLWSDLGIHSYCSKVEIRNNQILRNNYGLVGFHNSDLVVLGDSAAEDNSETQLIADNTRCQCLFNMASFPIEFHWNVIRDTSQYSYQYHPFIKTVEYDELMNDTTGASDWKGDPFLDVINNCWLNDTNPADDRLLPIGAYFWRDPWCPGEGGHLKSENIPQSIYYQAYNDILDSNYLDAESEFKQVISQYPESKYAIASLKGLYALNPALSDSNYTFLIIYLDSLALNPGDSLLGKTAEWFSIRCHIEDQNYQSAINSLDSILANPGSYADSVFALIDLSEIFAEISDTSGLKRSLVTLNPQVIPGSYNQFLTQRKDWIDLLLQSDDIGPKIIIPSASDLSNGNSIGNITSIHPNPFNHQFSVEYELLNEGIPEISVITTTGQLILNNNYGQKSVGDYQEILSLPTVQKGILFLVLKLDGAIIDTEKVLCY